MDVGRDNAVTNGAKGHSQALLFGRDLLLEAFAFGHITDHCHIKHLLIDNHLAERHFDRKGDMFACSAHRKRGAASALNDLLPGTGHWFTVVRASVPLWN